ncbi:hypothetical protein F5887DRAFT_1160678 [Amanita rubescens]|nr:hypothetical protein F5887DRAFT_1160678 [Amanita rubescens]
MKSIASWEEERRSISPTKRWDIYCQRNSFRMRTKRLRLGFRVTGTLRNKQWLASVIGLGASLYDEDALWDVVVKTVRGGVRDPKRCIEEMLREKRAGLVRLTPQEAYMSWRMEGAPRFWRTLGRESRESERAE